MFKHNCIYGHLSEVEIQEGYMMDKLKNSLDPIDEIVYGITQGILND